MRKAKNIGNVFPRIFCLEDIQCSSGDAGGFDYRATLYHDRACVTVSFSSPERDLILKVGELVSVRWLSDMQSDHGAVRVAGLTMLDAETKKSICKDFNPFLIVPHTWSVDRHLINCARDLWNISSKEMKQMLFSTILGQPEYAKRQKQHGL